MLDDEHEVAIGGRSSWRIRQQATAVDHHGRMPDCRHSKQPT
jgi:hypothetical protein